MIARWAGRPIATFQGGGFEPLVIGPRTIPVVDDEPRAIALPELAVLSALAHGSDDDATAIRVARAAIAGVEHVARHDEDRGKLYGDAVLSALGAAARAVVEEEIMKSEGIEYRSDLARRLVQEGPEKGRAEGRADAYRTMIASTCARLGIALGDARAAELSSLDADRLEELLTTLTREGRWPE